MSTVNQELSLDSLQFRRLHLKLCLFYRLYENNQPSCLSNIILQQNSAYNIRNVDKIPLFNVGHNFFKNDFFPSTVMESNKLDLNIYNENNLRDFLKKYFSIHKATFKQFL